MCPLIFVPPELPAEKEAEPSRGKEARVPEREGLRHSGLPRGPALSQADQWLRPAAGVFRQDHRFQAWSSFSRGWPLLLLPWLTIEEGSHVGLCNRAQLSPRSCPCEAVFPKLFYIFLLILSTAVQLPTPLTLTSCPQPNALP